MVGRACIAGVVAAVLAGCGGDTGPRASATATAKRAGPELISACGGASRRWHRLPVRAHGDALDAAVLGAGPVGVVFANESGNSPCEWLGLAGELARGGRRVAVFDYLDPGSDDAEALAVARALRAAGARRVALVGASIGGRAVVQAAARRDAPVAAAGSLSAERWAGPDLLPVARRVHVPSLYIGSEHDGYTMSGRDTRRLHRITPAQLSRMLLVPGGDHGVDLLSDASGPRVRAAIAAFIASAAAR